MFVLKATFSFAYLLLGIFSFLSSYLSFFSMIVIEDFFYVLYVLFFFSCLFCQRMKLFHLCIFSLGVHIFFALIFFLTDVSILFLSWFMIIVGLKFSFLSFKLYFVVELCCLLWQSLLVSSLFFCHLSYLTFVHHHLLWHKFVFCGWVVLFAFMWQSYCSISFTFFSLLWFMCNTPFE